jgi:hypothetical protein
MSTFSGICHNIKMDIVEIRCESVDWTELVQARIQLSNTVIPESFSPAE